MLLYEVMNEHTTACHRSELILELQELIRLIESKLES